jgi:DnaJ-class molecular chaperone
MSMIKCNECDGTGIVDNYYTTPSYNPTSSDYGVAGMSTFSREELCLKCNGDGHE